MSSPRPDAKARPPARRNGGRRGPAAAPARKVPRQSRRQERNGRRETTLPQRFERGIADGRLDVVTAGSVAVADRGHVQALHGAPRGRRGIHAGCKKFDLRDRHYDRPQADCCAPPTLRCSNLACGRAGPDGDEQAQPSFLFRYGSRNAELPSGGNANEQRNTRRTFMDLISDRGRRVTNRGTQHVAAARACPQAGAQAQLRRHPDRRR